MKVKIMPYKAASCGVSRLVESLQTEGIPCMKVFPDKNYYPKKDHLIINWGRSKKPNWYSSRFCSNMLNKPPNVALATNKLLAFQAWESWNKVMPDNMVNIPEFDTNPFVADRWVEEKSIVIGRYKLQGHSGEGICLFDEKDDWLPSEQRVPLLYVKYIKKSKEYRVHVFKGQVIDIQQKRTKRGVPAVNYKIRTHGNGWVFTRSNIETHGDIISSLAIKAVRALGLDFGGVDIIWNDHYNKAYVLEVNTAPGIENTTVTSYVKAIRNLL